MEFVFGRMAFIVSFSLCYSMEHLFSHYGMIWNPRFISVVAFLFYLVPQINQEVHVLRVLREKQGFRLLCTLHKTYASPHFFYNRGGILKLATSRPSVSFCKLSHVFQNFTNWETRIFHVSYFAYKMVDISHLFYFTYKDVF